ncbi:hypothetical protein ABIC05_006459, partial [Bradyrhizobium sp. RT7a]
GFSYNHLCVIKTPAFSNYVFFYFTGVGVGPGGGVGGGAAGGAPGHDSGAWSYPARCLSYAFRCVYAMRSFGTGTLAASARAMRSPTT